MVYPLILPPKASFWKIFQQQQQQEAEEEEEQERRVLLALPSQQKILVL